ncbi:MAG: hypothetical protein CL608_03540 [Anaerolineaceae bacterium]|nr:hypothetical protein [Anaerolineaceae bacterium]
MVSRKHIRLGTVANIPIDLHVGCLFFVPLGIVVMALAPLVMSAEWSPLERWLLAAATTGLMALSVFLHDVGHLVVAGARKLPVHQIVLYPFGGVYRLGSTPISAKKLVQMALVGPLVSLLLAVFWLGIWSIWAEAHVLWLAQFNLLLVVINLMPTPPLDGGHLLWLLPEHAASPQGGSPIAFLAISMLLLGMVLPGGTAVLIGLLLSDAASTFGGMLLLTTGWLVIEAPAQTVHVCTPEQQRWLAQTTVAQIISSSQSEPTVKLNHDFAYPARQFPIMTAVPARPDVLQKQLPFRTLEPWVVYPTTSMLQALHKLDASRGNRLLVVANGRIITTLTKEKMFAPFKMTENLLQLKAESFILLQPNEPEQAHS